MTDYLDNHLDNLGYYRFYRMHSCAQSKINCKSIMSVSLSLPHQSCFSFNKWYFAVFRWIWSSQKSSQMVLGTWSPSCSATAQSTASHYRASSTTRGCAPMHAESCRQSAPHRNPEPTWPFYLTLRAVLFLISPLQQTLGPACFGFTAMGFKLPLSWHILWCKCIPSFYIVQSYVSIFV